MKRADMEARLAELEQEYEKARLTAAAVDGAIQQVRWTLERWDDEKPLKVVKDAEQLLKVTGTYSNKVVKDEEVDHG